ncbi:MAG: hypothetical protein HWN65_11445 [Candidatus Helarchaeota archaeon]|nr:hypothetical protein [Candidatus Helarchaeota archaeon]
MDIVKGIKPYLITTAGLIISGILAFTLFYLTALKAPLLSFIFGINGAFIGGFMVFILVNSYLSSETWTGLYICNALLTVLGVLFLIYFFDELRDFFQGVVYYLVGGFPYIFIFGTFPYSLGTYCGNAMRLRLNKMDEKKKRKYIIIISCVIVFGICGMYLLTLILPPISSILPPAD